MKTVELTRACHEVSKQVESQAGEKLVGTLGFRFNNSYLYAVGKTPSNRLIYYELAFLEFEDPVEIKMADSIARLEAFVIFFAQLAAHANSFPMTQNGLERLIVLSLVDFFRIHYHSFD